MIDPGLEGRVVLVTGANTGIGASTARAFGEQGASTVVHYLSPPESPPEPGVQVEYEAPGRPAAEAVAAAVEDAGGRVELVEGDLARPETAPALFQRAEEAFGPVEILVNNAAHCETPDTILEATARGLDRHLAVNARSPVLLMRELAVRARDREGGGRIVNVSTDAARAFATQVGYGASKAALEAFTRSAAIELGPLGITVNAVAPGPVQTGWMSEELVEEVVPWIPLGRVGTPEEIADAVVFLASDQAAWITGQVIQVAGGHAL